MLQANTYAARILIFGNSGAGKSTRAKAYAKEYQLAHFDLDTIAWNNTNPPTRKALDSSIEQLTDFTSTHETWVIEGCYADLIEVLLSSATHVIFIDLPVEKCIENAKNRPWEPHKYGSKAEQDANLQMLLEWIRGYESRNDVFSRQAHNELYLKAHCNKVRIASNEQSYKLD